MAKLKWISIKNDLPPIDEEVLVCNCYQEHIPSQAARYDDLDDAFYSSTYNIVLRGECVTHWMPFPSFEDLDEEDLRM